MVVLTTVGLQQSIRNGWPRVWLAYFDHPDGEIRSWTGVGDLEYDGEIYKGIGEFGGIGGVGGSKRLSVRQITFELRGIPEEAAKQLNKDITGRAARAWIAGMDREGSEVNGAAWQLVDGKADYQELPLEEDGTVKVRLQIVEPVFSIERAQELRWTPQWMREQHGSDITGLDRMSDLANAAKNWTRT